MAFEELKKRQSLVWGAGSYEGFPEHYVPLLDHLARALDPRPGERVLDVGTGTGALATRLARTGADVTGLDLAPALIETARSLAREEGADVRYDVGDAEELPYETASFDAVTSCVGSIFAPDHEAVARELARVCRPGGRLALGHWSSEHGTVDMFKVMAPYMPAPPPGAGSPFQWGDREYVERRLGEDFDLRFEEGDAPQEGASGEEVWELFSTVYGPTRVLADSLDPERCEELHRVFADFYEGFRTDGGVHQPRPYLVVLGTRRG
ncbi:class I SAM-dependent methyltransferase [Nonomuraea lactucae]|uniref:class I SAM-dependent methyltransferase n=1 Tax=Nonomuraea lactucae TaxID=2249762 RepID=UPI000DE3F7A5|nr:class I SAM-dependent methyltransferase [Nonomuraea lactucae]